MSLHLGLGMGIDSWSDGFPVFSLYFGGTHQIIDQFSLPSDPDHFPVPGSKLWVVFSVWIPEWRIWSSDYMISTKMGPGETSKRKEIVGDPSSMVEIVLRSELLSHSGDNVWCLRELIHHWALLMNLYPSYVFLLWMRFMLEEEPNEYEISLLLPL